MGAMLSVTVYQSLTPLSHSPSTPHHHKAIFLGVFLRVHLVRSWMATPCRKVGRPFYPVYAHLGYCKMHMNTASKTVM